VGSCDAAVKRARASRHLSVLRGKHFAAMGMFGAAKKKVAKTRRRVAVNPLATSDTMKDLTPEQQRLMRDMDAAGTAEEAEIMGEQETRKSEGLGGLRSGDQNARPDSEYSESESGVSESEEEEDGVDPVTLARQTVAEIEAERVSLEAAEVAEAVRLKEEEERHALEAAAHASLEKVRDELIAALHKKLDVDNSGGVSIGELVKAMRKDGSLAETLGLASRILSQHDGSLDRIARLFWEHDSDQNNELCLDEFTKMIKTVSKFVLPASMRSAAEKAENLEFEIARGDAAFDVTEFARSCVTNVLRANGETVDGSCSSDGSDDDAPKPASPPPPATRSLENATATAGLARTGDQTAVDAIFTFLDKDNSGTVTVREMIIGVRKEPALAQTLGLGEGVVDQDRLVSMFSKWDENGDRELDRHEFDAIFGASVADAKMADDAVIVARQVSEEQGAREEFEAREKAALERNAEKQEMARLRTELDAMKMRMDLSLTRPATGRRALRRVSPGGTTHIFGGHTFEAGYVSGGSGPGSGARKSPSANQQPQKPEWVSPSYASYLDSPEFKTVGVAEAIAHSAQNSSQNSSQNKPNVVNGLWREQQNMTALRPTTKKTRAVDVIAEQAPIAKYKETWRDGLRNGDITKYKDQKPRPAGSPLPDGFERSSYTNAGSLTELLADVTALSPGSYFGGGKRMFSRAFTRHYLSPNPHVDDRNFIVDPPGVKTAHESIVGVTGLASSRHKEDLTHRGSTQPLSFHRNVVGANATTHTSTAPGELTQYPKTERSVGSRVWVPG